MRGALAILTLVLTPWVFNAMGAKAVNASPKTAVLTRPAAVYPVTPQRITSAHIPQRGTGGRVA